MPCPRCGNAIDFALHKLCPSCECDEEEEKTIDAVVALRARVAELEAAIIWALGAGEDFPLRGEGQGAYWWREELQKRAGLKWDGGKFISK